MDLFVFVNEELCCLIARLDNLGKGAAGAAVESWLLVSAFNTAFLNPEAALYQYVVTVGVFPILAWGFLRWQRTFLRLE